MAYKSNLPAVLARHQRAVDAGLIAAVQVPMNKTKEDLRGGFTSGAFTTGHSTAAVNRSEPQGPPNARYILYGTDVLYNLFWTVGHFNIFLRRFVRVDKWLPHFFGTRAEQLAAFERAYRQVFGANG